MENILSIQDLGKTYAGGHQALKGVSLDIRRGEIFALLGPNGAGKTTLIGVTCGLVNPSSGRVLADGHDVVRDYRKARATIGLVPQELTTDAFETVWATVNLSRGLFGFGRDDAHLEKVLRSLSLWEKRDAKIMTLSGGMKRRVLIAKALSHNPRILFLDEPSAGVDVELRRDMWEVVRKLRDDGVTIILTTHYIEEAEEMADRIGIIAKGELLLVEKKADLMRNKIGYPDVWCDYGKYKTSSTSFYDNLVGGAAFEFGVHVASGLDGRDAVSRLAEAPCDGPDAGADLEHVVAEVGLDGVGDPSQEVVGVGQCGEFVDRAELRVAGRRLGPQPRVALCPQRLVRPHVAAHMVHVAADRREALR